MSICDRQTNRQQILGALGLVDWQVRVDGPLSHSSVPKAALATQPTPPPDLSPEAPPEHAVAAPPMRERGIKAVAVEAATQPIDHQPPRPDDAEADRVAADMADSDDGRDTTPERESLPSPTRTMDWDQLEAWLAQQDHRGAQRPVFGVGARDAEVLIVGEAPGANEDAQGVPFVGRAGQLLDRMLFAIGCSRDTNVYITNICKFRPPNNRDPNADEVAADWPVLERQIELMNPKLVVAVGRVAAQTLLGSTEALGKMRGRLHKYPQRDLDVLATYHPAFLLRSPQQKAKSWDDLRKIAHHIGRFTDGP